MASYRPLDADRIESARQNAHIGRKTVLFRSTASTNDIAAEYAGNAANDGLCVLAETQSKGRGRRGRTWFSEPGQSILCSVLLTKTDVEAELLTLTAAVATAEAIQQTCDLSCRIKWPNDILIKGQKVAGILVEKRIKKNRPCFIVGIGINCNQSRETFEKYTLNLPATSLAVETGKPVDRTGLVCELLEQFEHWLDTASHKLSPCRGTVPRSGEGVITRWLELSGMLGQHVTVEYDGRQFSGFCRGIDPTQGLILQLDNSLVGVFSTAHTSLV